MLAVSGVQQIYTTWIPIWQFNLAYMVKLYVIYPYHYNKLEFRNST